MTFTEGNEHLNTEETLKDRFLTFTIDDVTYGIEMFYIREIISIQNITEIPEMPAYIKGVINLRGLILPVMDVRLRFEKNHKNYDDRTCAIIVEISGNTVGLIVDSVSEVLSIQSSEISNMPDVGDGRSSRFIKNIGKNSSSVVLIVDSEKLLSDKDLELLCEFA